MGRTKVNKCPTCQGNGFTIATQGQLSGDGRSVNLSNVAYKLCSRCRGLCIVGIKELENLNPTQLDKIVHGKTYEQIVRMFDNKTPQELQIILASVL